VSTQAQGRPGRRRSLVACWRRRWRDTTCCWRGSGSRPTRVQPGWTGSTSSTRPHGPEAAHELARDPPSVAAGAPPI